MGDGDERRERRWKTEAVVKAGARRGRRKTRSEHREEGDSVTETEHKEGGRNVEDTTRGEPGCAIAPCLCSVICALYV